MLSRLIAFIQNLKVQGDGLRNNPSPSKLSQNHCKNPLQRREWRMLNDDEKHRYLDAIKCLRLRPSKGHLEGAKTRYDDFQIHHIDLSLVIHSVGQFLPWHRLYVKSYEDALRNECGYNDAQPYWDWTLDSGSEQDFFNSPIFDPKTGFGGDGVPGTYILPPFTQKDRIFPDAYRGCVRDGPFANYGIHFGPGTLITDHCLVRGINASIAMQTLRPFNVANTTRQVTFETFRIELEGGDQTPIRKIHDGGHISVGGEMTNFYSSPADPTFLLHHANLDRIWWQWQNRDIATRMYAISGPTLPSPNPSPQVTLDFKLLMGAVGNSLLIHDVMDILNEEMCYSYIDSTDY